jgi:predicted metal-dependent phosphotriesterase family hydrolase
MTAMTTSRLTGNVQTVLGPVQSSALGVTMTHEHLLINLACVFREPSDASEPRSRFVRGLLLFVGDFVRDKGQGSNESNR